MTGSKPTHTDAKTRPISLDDAYTAMPHHSLRLTPHILP